MKHTFVTFVFVALLLAGAGRSACAQTAYPGDYYRPVENLPVENQAVDTRIRRLPTLDDGPSLGLQPELADVGEQLDADLPLEAVEVTEATQQAPPVKLWKGSLELGFNGSEGNTETLNFRFGFDAKRKTDANILDFDLDYHKKTADSEETANRLFFDSRWEWLHEDSPWTSFVHQTTEYDEFKAYNVRVTFDLGVGYQFFDTDVTSLTARLGSGVSHEIGGPDKMVVPELTCGVEFERQLTKRQKFRASTEFVPDVTDFSDFRLNSKIDWEVLLDEDWNLTLKLGILDRYDSTPNGSKPNDLDYSITFLWSF